MAATKKRNIRHSSGFDNKEMEGFFMISNKDVALAIVNKLTGSQLRLWLYLMMIDPFADKTNSGEKIYRPIPSPQEIAIKIGASPETVQKDMRKLKKFGLYEYRTTAWRGHNQSAANAKKESERLKKKKAQTKSEQNKRLNKPSKSLNNPPKGLNNPSESLNKPEPRLNNLSNDAENTEKSTILEQPQTSQTYTDFLNSLSEEEREDFLRYVKEQIKDFNKPIIDLEAWLASKTKANQNRWEVFFKPYQEDRQNQISTTSLDAQKQKAIAEFKKRTECN